MAVQSDWLEKNFYDVLGVPETATDEEISRAYRRLARQLHPDVNPDNKEAEERFKEVSAAYDVVGDPAKRKEYDEARRLLRAGVGPGFGGSGFSGPGESGFTFRIDDLGDFDDLGGFGGLFGDLLGGRRRATARPPGRRGADLETEVALSFEEAVFGVTTDVEVTAEDACPTCGGRRTKPGTQPVSCSSCGGSGVTAQRQGGFSVSRTCPACGGRGTVITDPCADCRGLGRVRRARRAKVRIPAGVDNGQLIRVPGRGNAGRDGGPAGDLYVVVRVAPHPVFGREGRNLTVTVPITYPEAVLGAEVKVPTLDGSPVTIRIPPGTPSGKTFRVRGHGVPGAGGRRGDLLVTAEVAVPPRVTGKERKAVEALAKVTPSPRAHLGV
ncbi:MAG: molecular chaperone DnaJ [Actinomycetota bacterium]|jgi:molecular chaperone DnaJ